MESELIVATLHWVQPLLPSVTRSPLFKSDRRSLRRKSGPYVNVHVYWVHIHMYSVIECGRISKILIWFTRLGNVCGSRFASRYVHRSPVLISQCSHVLGAVLHPSDDDCCYTEEDADSWSALSLYNERPKWREDFLSVQFAGKMNTPIVAGKHLAALANDGSLSPNCTGTFF